MSPNVLFFAALIVALIGELIDRGRSWYGWAIVLACLGLLWGVIKL